MPVLNGSSSCLVRHEKGVLILSDRFLQNFEKKVLNLLLKSWTKYRQPPPPFLRDYNFQFPSDPPSRYIPLDIKSRGDWFDAMI